MSKIKITLADAKAELREAATGPRSQHWSYAPAVMALLNSHDELLAILGEATEALEEKDRQVKELLAAREAQYKPAELYLCRVTRDGEELYSPCGKDYPRGRGYYTAPPAPKVPDFGKLTKEIVENLVDCGAADDDAIAQYEEFVYKACRAAIRC